MNEVQGIFIVVLILYTTLVIYIIHLDRKLKKKGGT